MTFGRRKITGGKPQFELIRYCSLPYTQIIGGASKLFQHFINNYEYSEIVTYADCRYSNGKFYKQLNFTFDHKSKPNYFYLDRVNRTGKRENRINYQKHKLKSKLDSFDPELTE
ncbi:MAG: hypothetical protein ACOC56_06255 [Atribacterota bacterium]